MRVHQRREDWLEFALELLLGSKPSPIAKSVPFSLLGNQSKLLPAPVAR